MERPYVHINCAASLDGKISKPDGSRLRISGEHDMERVHRLRSDMGAVLVGAGTVISDDPKLRVKEIFVPRPPPIFKIIMDGRGTIPTSSRFLRTPGRSIIATSKHCSQDWLKGIGSTIEEEELDAEVVRFPDVDGNFDPRTLLEELASRGITSLLVEGGSNIIWQFVSGELFDKMTIYFGPMMVGGAGPTIMGGEGHMQDPISVVVQEMLRSLDGGMLVTVTPSVHS